MVTARSDLIPLINKEYDKAFFENTEYMELPDTYSSLVEYKQLQGAFERSHSTVGLGVLSEKAEGAPVVEQTLEKGYELAGKARTFINYVEFTKEAIDDDMFGQVDKFLEFAEEWKHAYELTRRQSIAALLNNGGLTAGHSCFNQTTEGYTDTSGDLIYDGQPFFAASGNGHPLKGAPGVTKYNHMGALSISAANLKTAFLHMQGTNNVNEKNQKIQLVPTDIVIPAALDLDVRQLVFSQLLPGGTNNDVNPVYNRLEIKVLHEIDDTDAWFLHSNNVPGIVFLERQAPQKEITYKDDNHNMRVTVYARWGIYVKNWRSWLCSNLRTS